MGKKVIIKGVGTLMAMHPNGKEIITLGTLQNLRIDMSVEAEDIFGGDGTFPIDQLIRQKLIEVTATDAKYDLAAASIMLGDTVKENQTTTLWSLNEVKRVKQDGTDLAVILNYRSVGGMNIRKQNSGEVIPLSSVTTSDVTEGGRTVTKVTFEGTEVEEGDMVVFNYKHEVSGVDVMDIFKDSIPFPVHVVHHGAFEQKQTGKIRGVETELYSCLARGNFTIDASRATASASTITLQVMDPELECGKLGSIKIFELDKLPCRS